MSGTVVFSPQLMLIRAGWFWMGSESGQENERPAHQVWIDDFELAAFQVTNAAYTVFLEATGREPPPTWGQPQFNDPEQPVVAVSWFDAEEFCLWLSELTRESYRLPTEAEWERAARGGAESRLYPWGDDPPESLPGYATRWEKGPEQVGRNAANGYGLYDMCENVHEWCADWYDAGYYSTAPKRNPRGPATGSRRVSRGGSWRHHIKATRCAARSSIPPSFKYADYGFRVARDIR
jgi:formylglycine-generating enzyme required for sulfatase activity